MDRLIYTAMTGLKHIMEQQSTTANNLANSTTTGFRAQIDSFRAVPVLSDGLPTRAFVVDATVGTNFNSGVINTTGRELDVAIRDRGWFAVQRPDGTEAYTRNGNFKLNENGVLQTQDGLTVVGDGGPITIPPEAKIAFANDGTVSAVATNVVPLFTNLIGRLKLVNPNDADLVRGTDGLFETKNRQPLNADATVTVASGALEGSNVNVVEEMVNMISQARQFDLQTKLIQNAENNATKAGQIFSLS
ncbi:flagellar basal-body rod protein FlgF [Methylobacillus flagellatus]|uniref:flagellar basal-body rod protein FlgF n=1 Tax=Methylobacillus flagellatus TaxID=405 RepID=UPI0028540BBE|nr:flagellar basal-body rod protein FlgF [Methylobacillus flagellatus]MDR5172577.1 flagellar basal-body rod protein FlgF [Methylobacillus flagellatus]